jgi:glycosyltransferase involved in cell wall biosynthesis
MKILIINESLNLGGVERMTVVLANSMGELPGMSIHVAASDGLLRHSLNTAVHYHKLPRFNIFSLYRIVKELAAVIARVKPDIIHSQGASLGLLASIASKRSPHKTFHILTHHSRKSQRIPKNVANYFFGRYFDHMIAISRSKYDALIASGIKATNVSLIPNCIDCKQIRAEKEHINRRELLKEMGIDTNDIVIAMTGRLIPIKRFDLFITILADCSQLTGHRLHGLIIGDGPERGKLERLADTCKNTVDIRFLGYQKDVIKYLSISNLFLFPSTREVLPVALIEASAVGLPVICSHVVGNSDVITDNYNGFLVSGDHTAYSKKILELINNEHLYNTMSDNGIALVNKQFDKDVVINQIVSLYKQKVQPAHTAVSEQDGISL